MGITVADTLGGTIVNEQGNGILANITLQPLVQVVREVGVVAFGMFEIETVSSYTIVGETPFPEQIFYENSEIRLLPVPDREVQFPDAMLLSEVRLATGVQAPLPIMLSYVTPITYFNIIDRNVADLSGLENMVNISSLNISYNVAIQDITLLAHLTRLSSLDAEGSGIDDITPLAALTYMRSLRLNENSITNITGLSRLTRLTTLELNMNQVTDISPLANMDDLYWLYLGGNMISDISVLEGLPNLYWLSLNDNMITDILPLVNNTGLGSYDVVDLWNNTALADDPTQLEHVAALRARGVTVNMSAPAQ